MSSKKQSTQAGSIAVVPQTAQIEIISRRKVVDDKSAIETAAVHENEAADADVPIGTLNVELVNVVKQGLQAELTRAQAIINKYQYGTSLTSVQKKDLKVARRTATSTSTNIKLLDKLLAKWQEVSKQKNIVDTGKTTIRMPKGTQKEIMVTGAYKNIHQQKFHHAARQYNMIASTVRQRKIDLLTPEMVPNAIKGHQIRAKRCNAHESSIYCTTTQCDVEPDDLYLIMHQSRRHTCRCDASQLKSLLELAIVNGVLGVRSQAKQFGKSELFSMPTDSVEKECLLIRCCGIMSTGGQCLTLMDPLDPTILELLAPMLEIAAEQRCDDSSQPSTTVTDKALVNVVDHEDSVLDTESEATAIQAALLLEAADDTESGMGDPMESEHTPPAFTTIAEYKEFVSKYFRMALQNKYGMDVYTFCPNDKCLMHVNGFFVDEILQRRIKGVKDDDFITGYHANCPSCKTFWCLNCKTDHRGKICPGPYAQYMPDIEREAIEDYKITHAEEPSTFVCDRLLTLAIRAYHGEHGNEPDAETIEHLRRTAILAFKRQYGSEPVGEERTKCLDDARKKFFATNKMCPSCKKLTEKTYGCNHMHCTSTTFRTKDGHEIVVNGCGHHWCFRCGGHRDPRNHNTHTCPEGIEYDVKFDSHSEQMRRSTQKISSFIN